MAHCGQKFRFYVIGCFGRACCTAARCDVPANDSSHRRTNDEKQQDKSGNCIITEAVQRFCPISNVDVNFNCACEDASLHDWDIGFANDFSANSEVLLALYFFITLPLLHQLQEIPLDVGLAYIVRAGGMDDLSVIIEKFVPEDLTGNAGGMDDPLILFPYALTR
jgi:hypothetical protein